MNTEKIVLENYQLAPATVRIKGQDEYLFTVHHSTDYKRTKKDAAEIGEIIVTRFNNYDSLLNALKTAYDCIIRGSSEIKYINDIEEAIKKAEQ